MRVQSAVCVVMLLFTAAGCGGGKVGGASASNAPGGPLAGNWQIVLAEGVPRIPAQLLVSGFLLQSKNSITGSVQVPGNGAQGQQKCAGVGLLSGTVDGNSVTFAINEGGTTLTFNGALSSDGTMAGDYEGPGGACLGSATSGTWTAAEIPELNGNFSGTISNSSYMALVTGMNADQVPPIQISATFNQSPNIGASNATLTGTMNAQGYPCFATAYLTGTISGSNVVLSVFGFDGTLIGSLGTGTAPATVSSGSSGVSLTTVIPSSLVLGEILPGGTQQGPCPKLLDASGNTVQFDNASLALTQKQ